MEEIILQCVESKKYKEVETATSKGILINKINAEKYCIKKIVI